MKRKERGKRVNTANEKREGKGLKLEDMDLS